MAEGFRQITSYLPEGFQQITSYLPEGFRQITSSLNLTRMTFLRIDMMYKTMLQLLLMLRLTRLTATFVTAGRQGERENERKKKRLCEG